MSLLLPVGLLRWGAVLDITRSRGLGIWEALGLGARLRKGTKVGEPALNRQPPSPK